MTSACSRLAAEIELDTEPAQPLDHRRSDRRTALADTGGEDERVDAAHGCRQGTGRARDPVDEIVDRQPRARGVAHLEVAHVVADARQALEPAIVVQEAFDLLGAVAAVLDEIKHDAGVELAGAAPMGSPSTAVKPMVLSMLRPPRIAHMDAPEPRWHTTTARWRGRARSRGAERRHTRRKGHESRSGAAPAR